MSSSNKFGLAVTSMQSPSFESSKHNDDCPIFDASLQVALSEHWSSFMIFSLFGELYFVNLDTHNRTAEDGKLRVPRIIGLGQPLATSTAFVTINFFFPLWRSSLPHPSTFTPIHTRRYRKPRRLLFFLPNQSHNVWIPRICL